MKPTNTPSKSRLILVVITILVLTSMEILAKGGGPNRRNQTYYTLTNSVYQNVSLSYMVSGSGHQPAYSLNYSINKKQYTLGGGLMMGVENKNFDGLFFSYKNSITPKTSPANVYLLTTTTFHYKSNLSERVDALVYNNNEPQSAKNTFNTIELYLGFGVQKQVFNNVFVDFNIGTGCYSRKRVERNDHRIRNYGRYSDDRGVGLNIQFGIGYSL